MSRSKNLFLPLFFLFLTFVTALPNVLHSTSQNQILIGEKITIIQSYIPPFFPVSNFKEQMTLSPIFTPNNALDTYIYWINKANTSIHIQNPYITKFNSSAWPTASPLVSAIVQAFNRGVSIEIQVNQADDSDNVATYFKGLGIPIKYMGTSSSSSGGSYIATTHNKLMIIDGKVTIISSINFSENAFLNNREAGMVIQNAHVASAFEIVFQSDWADGLTPTLQNGNQYMISPDSKVSTSQSITYSSPFNIPKTNFTGVYNVSVFTNPDNADKFIFQNLQSAKKSIYVSMYTISRPDFNNTLIALKKSNPSLDIEVLISRDRVGASEDIDTIQAVKSLVANLIPVYNSTSQLNYYHNKYWIIDGNDTFVYSGNWSPASVTPNATSYASSTPNRDMGLAVLDAPDIANFFINQVWKKDIAIGSAWPLASGVKQTGFKTGDVVSGNVTLQAVVSNINTSSIYYKWNNDSYVSGSLPNNLFTKIFDTNTLTNGVNTFTVKVVSNNSQEFTDSVKVTVANYPSGINWRVLLTEVLANPSTTTDALGEYYQITNSFPFEVLLDGWSTGVKDTTFNFPANYVIPAYTSIIFARNATGFEQAFGVSADFSYSFSLANTADYVFLKNANGEYIDVVAYGMTAPDGSETISAAPSGKSLQRIPLYIDTNTAADFTTAAPNPKGSVPHVSLNETGLSTANKTSTTAVPLDFILFSLVMMGSYLFFLRRKKV